MHEFHDCHLRVIGWMRWRKSTSASDVRVRNVVQGERIRLSGGSFQPQNEQLCSPIKALTTLRW